MNKFAFGNNWKSYVAHALTYERLQEAENSLQAYLPASAYRGVFIDIGCGSGIFSLAALRRGAMRVISLDVDRESLEATESVRTRFNSLLPPSAIWEIRFADILDPSNTASLVGVGDVVYSWGVLHHTGDMRRAIENAARLVKTGGYFIIALYNRAPSSGLWLRVKRAYVRAPKLVQHGMVWFFYGYAMVLFAASSFRQLVSGRGVRFPQQRRGMSHFYNMVDWVGGYPYEYASIDEVRQLVEPLGFLLVTMPSALSSLALHWWDRFTFKNTGNSEFIFQKII